MDVIERPFYKIQNSSIQIQIGMVNLPLATICWHFYFYCIHLRMANNFTTTFCVTFVALGYLLALSLRYAVFALNEHWNKYQHSIRWIQNKCNVSMECWTLNMDLHGIWSLYILSTDVPSCTIVKQNFWQAHSHNDGMIKAFLRLERHCSKHNGLGAMVFAAIKSDNWCFDAMEFDVCQISNSSDEMSNWFRRKILNSFKWCAEKRVVALNSIDTTDRNTVMVGPPLKWILNIIQNRIWAATK